MAAKRALHRKPPAEECFQTSRQRRQQPTGSVGQIPRVRSHTVASLMGTSKLAGPHRGRHRICHCGGGRVVTRGGTAAVAQTSNSTHLGCSAAIRRGAHRRRRQRWQRDSRTQRSPPLGSVFAPTAAMVAGKERGVMQADVIVKVEQVRMPGRGQTAVDAPHTPSRA